MSGTSSAPARCPRRRVRGIFDRHVLESDEAEEVIDRRAADLTTDDYVDVIGAVVKAGKGRQAGKLRSYLRGRVPACNGQQDRPPT